MISRSVASTDRTVSRIPELDGIRGVAVALVLVYHYFNQQIVPTRIGSVFSYVHLSTSMFWSGVDLFFVLSGFLIGGILLDHHRAPNLLRIFYLRRAYRILPVYAAVLLAFIALRAVLDGNRFAWLFSNAMPLASYATFTQNFAMATRETFGAHFLGMTWSLAIEEQFYLVMPLALLLLGKRAWTALLLPLAATAPLLRILFPGYGTIVHMPFRMDALLLGAALAAAYRTPRVWQIAVRYRAALALLFTLLLALAARRTYYSITGPMTYTFFACLYAVFIAAALAYQGHAVTAPLRCGILPVLGALSYGLYMYHQAVSGLLHGWLLEAAPSLVSPDGRWVTALALACTLGLGWLSSRVLEQPILRRAHAHRFAPPPA